MPAVNETFFRPKNVGFLIINWGGQLTWTGKLIDCSLAKTVIRKSNTSREKLGVRRN